MYMFIQKLRYQNMLKNKSRSCYSPLEFSRVNVCYQVSYKRHSLAMNNNENTLIF